MPRTTTNIMMVPITDSKAPLTIPSTIAYSKNNAITIIAANAARDSTFTEDNSALSAEANALKITPSTKNISAKNDDQNITNATKVFLLTQYLQKTF